MSDETLEQIATRHARSTREFIEDCEARAETFKKAGDEKRAGVLRDLIDKHLKPLLDYEESVAGS